MNNVFIPHLRKFILVFFDEILVYSRSYARHLVHLKIMFRILRQHTLFAKRTKCSCAKQELEYFGHIIANEGATTDPNKITAIKNWPLLTMSSS